MELRPGRSAPCRAVLRGALSAAPGAEAARGGGAQPPAESPAERRGGESHLFEPSRILGDFP